MIRLSASNSVRTAGKIPKPHPDSDGDLHVRRWRRRWRLITLETALLISALRAFLIFFFRWSPSFLRLTSWNMRRTLSSEGHKNTRTNLNFLFSLFLFLFLILILAWICLAACGCCFWAGLLILWLFWQAIKPFGLCFVRCDRQLLWVDGF